MTTAEAQAHQPATPTFDCEQSYDDLLGLVQWERVRPRRSTRRREMFWMGSEPTDDVERQLFVAHFRGRELKLPVVGERTAPYDIDSFMAHATRDRFEPDLNEQIERAWSR